MKKFLTNKFIVIFFIGIFFANFLLVRAEYLEDTWQNIVERFDTGNFWTQGDSLTSEEFNSVIDQVITNQNNINFISMFSVVIDKVKDLEEKFASFQGIKLDENLTDCDTENEGTLRYDQEVKAISFCDGTEWTEIGGISASCLEIKNKKPSSESGLYQIKPDKNSEPFYVYCDMETDGGGWTLTSKFTNQDEKNWISSRTNWKNSAPFGDTTNLSINKDAKSESWNILKSNEIMWTSSDEVGKYMKTTNNCLEGKSLANFFGEWIDSYPDMSSVNYKKKCNIIKTHIGIPHWGKDFHSIYSDNNIYGPSHGYIVFGKSDAVDTYGIISTFVDAYEEADTGLGVDEQNERGFGTDGTAQDVGAPSGCSPVYTDSGCISTYPETVFMFVR